MGKKQQQVAEIGARKQHESAPLYRRMPIIATPLDLESDTMACDIQVSNTRRQYRTFPQLAMYFMNRAEWDVRDFERETLYDESTYRLLRGYWLGTQTGRHFWTPQLCLGIIAGLRLPKDEAVALLAAASHTFDKTSDEEYIVYDYLITNYSGRPIAQWNQFLKAHNMRQIGE